MACTINRRVRNDAVKVVLTSIVVATLSLTPTTAFGQTKSSTKSVDSLGSVIKEATRIRDQVHGAIESLGVLTSGDESKLPKHFRAYSKHVEKMTKAQKATRNRVEDMRARREAYLQEWDKEMEAVKSPEVKAHMQERQQEVRKTLESAQPAGQAAREAFTPFLSDLQDIQKMLSLDLSRSGTAAAAPIAQRAIDEGNSVVSALDTWVSVLSEIKAQVSPKGK